jgi:hypothetical protein
MAWINLVSERPTQRALLDLDEFADGYEDFSELAPVLLQAALSDQRDRVKINVERAAEYLEASAAALRAGQMNYTSWVRYADVATCAILSHFCGCDEAKLLDAVLSAKPMKDQNFGAVHHLLSVGADSKDAGDGLSAPGHDDEELADWPKMVTKATPAEAVDLALCPDHPGWRNLQHFAAPAVFAALGPKAEPDEAFRMLAWAGRRDAGKGLVHVRTDAPPGPDPDAAGKNSKWAQGLDAVEKDGGGNDLCHYNMSMQHWAPWLCNDELDAFWFLTWFDVDWKAAAAASPKLGALDSKKAEVIIHYDPANSNVSKPDLARAEAKYGRSITMVDFTAA